MSLFRYLIDGSNLTSSEQLEVERYIKNAYTYSLVLGKVCTYEAFWYENVNPKTDIPFPPNCIIRKLN